MSFAQERYLSICSLVPGLDELETTSSKSDSSPSDNEDDENRSITPRNAHLEPLQVTSVVGSEDDEIGDGLRTFHVAHGESGAESVRQTGPSVTLPSAGGKETHNVTGTGERRRRKLPEIPKNKKRKTERPGGGFRKNQ